MASSGVGLPTMVQQRPENTKVPLDSSSIPPNNLSGEPPSGQGQIQVETESSPEVVAFANSLVQTFPTYDKVYILHRSDEDDFVFQDNAFPAPSSQTRSRRDDATPIEYGINLKPGIFFFRKPVKRGFLSTVNLLALLLFNSKYEGAKFVGPLEFGIHALQKVPATTVVKDPRIFESDRTTIEVDINQALKVQTGMTRFHFHPNGQDFKWLCFVKIADDSFQSLFRPFGDPEVAFGETMAVALEIFENVVFESHIRRQRSEAEKLKEQILFTHFDASLSSGDGMLSGPDRSELIALLAKDVLNITYDNLEEAVAAVYTKGVNECPAAQNLAGPVVHPNADALPASIEDKPMEVLKETLGSPKDVLEVGRLGSPPSTGVFPISCNDERKEGTESVIQAHDAVPVEQSPLVIERESFVEAGSAQNITPNRADTATQVSTTIHTQPEDKPASMDMERNARKKRKRTKKGKSKPQEEARRLELEDKPDPPASGSPAKPHVQPVLCLATESTQHETMAVSQHDTTVDTKHESTADTQHGTTADIQNETIADSQTETTADTHNETIADVQDETTAGSQYETTNVTQQDQQPTMIKFDDYQRLCQLPDCRQVTNPWDGKSVICPHCGPFSYVRYCCIQHLREDARMHWSQECRNYAVQKLVDTSTISPRQIAGPIALPSLLPGTVERHRQSVYHAMDTTGDYFVFTDYDMWTERGCPKGVAWMYDRCTGRLKLTVVFEDDQLGDSLKDRFNRILSILLFCGPGFADLAYYAFSMIRENLIAKALWDADIYNCLVYQFTTEFGWHPPQTLSTDTRHACPQEWLGRMHQNCPDPVCNYAVLDHETGKSRFHVVNFRTRVEQLESQFWLLRYARVYHPTVKDKRRRMQGEGFSEVPRNEQRVFSRGPEWDGLGAAPMEVEGSVWKVNTTGGPPYLYCEAAMRGQL